MSEVPSSAKSFVTVSEMADLCQLSRSRFYDLMEAGVFPRPFRHPTSKRPMFDRRLQEMCLAIRESGIDMQGQPILFNRKPRKAPKPQRKKTQEKRPDHGEMLDALKELGLVTTPQAVEEALAALFPTGMAGLDQGDVIRRVFLHLQGKRT
jgi:hypothetical protein